MKEKFEGPLAEPFEPLRFGISMTEGEKNERSAKRRGEEIRKLILLCEHYGIPSEPPMFLELALVLARKICPGFQELKPRGRKRKWTKLVGASLVVEIDRLVRPDDPAHGVSWAAEQLAKREPWKSFLEIKGAKETSPDPGEPLRKAYYEFCNDRWVCVVKDAFASYELTNRLTDWEELVADRVKNSGPD